MQGNNKFSHQEEKEYYVRKFEECSGQRALYNCVNNLIDRKKDAILPEYTSPLELANNFATYFKEKIINIRKSFPAKQTDPRVSSATFNGVPLELRTCNRRRNT